MENTPSNSARYDSGKTATQTGKGGVLILKLAGDPVTGRTTVKEQYSEVPLFAQRPMYLEDSLPSMAYMYIISPSGGILQGDTYRINVTLENSAQAHLTTQGATRLYKMNDGYATQQVNITADSGCYLEYMPDQIIPYAGSRFYQKTSLMVHENATVVYSEIISPGRAASGELFQYDICHLSIQGSDYSGKMKFGDMAILEPKKMDVRAQGMMERDVIANLYIMTPPQFILELNRLANTVFAEMKIRGGSSILPHNCGIAARMLGDYAGDLQRVIVKIAEITRMTVLGAPFTKMRKG